MTLNGRYALDCGKDASFGACYKNFNEKFEDRPILSAVRWATNRSEAAKIDIFYRMQRHSSDILSCNDTKTGDSERHLQLFNVRKLHRPRVWDADRTLCLLCFLS